MPSLCCHQARFKERSLKLIMEQADPDDHTQSRRKTSVCIAVAFSVIARLAVLSVSFVPFAFAQRKERSKRRKRRLRQLTRPVYHERRTVIGFTPGVGVTVSESKRSSIVEEVGDAARLLNCAFLLSGADTMQSIAIHL